jgi:hypothetical protein
MNPLGFASRGLGFMGCNPRKGRAQRVRDRKASKIARLHARHRYYGRVRRDPRRAHTTAADARFSHCLTRHLSHCGVSLAAATGALLAIPSGRAPRSPRASTLQEPAFGLKPLIGELLERSTRHGDSSNEHDRNSNAERNLRRQGSARGDRWSALELVGNLQATEVCSIGAVKSVSVTWPRPTLPKLRLYDGSSEPPGSLGCPKTNAP